MKYYAPRYLFRRFELLRRVQSRKSFLEIGPGKLDLAVELLKYFEDGTLIDFNSASRHIHAKLPASMRNRLELHIDDFQTCGKLNGRLFDCVVACEVMEHVEDDDRFLGRTHELLSAGGQLIISVPARMKYWSMHDVIAGHVRRYERDQLEGLLATTGFRDIEIVSYGFPFLHVLRQLRILLSHVQYKQKSKLDQEERTRESGMAGLTPLAGYMGIFVNKYTIYPMAKVSSVFSSRDWSEGYVAIARRGKT
jgi:SAM-dependent methyltransferase